MTEPQYPLDEAVGLGGTLQFARYRFKTTFGHRWGDYAVLVLLIGLIGGIAMGALQAGRRTQSSYPAFLAKTNASDLTMSTYGTGARQQRGDGLFAQDGGRDCPPPGCAKSGELGRRLRSTPAAQRCPQFLGLQ